MKITGQPRRFCRPAKRSSQQYRSRSMNARVFEGQTQSTKLLPLEWTPSSTKRKTMCPNTQKEKRSKQSGRVRISMAVKKRLKKLRNVDLNHTVRLSFQEEKVTIWIPSRGLYNFHTFENSADADLYQWVSSMCPQMWQQFQLFIRGRIVCLNRPIKLLASVNLKYAELYLNGELYALNRGEVSSREVTEQWLLFPADATILNAFCRQLMDSSKYREIWDVVDSFEGNVEQGLPYVQHSSMTAQYANNWRMKSVICQMIHCQGTSVTEDEQERNASQMKMLHEEGLKVLEEHKEILSPEVRNVWEFGIEKWLEGEFDETYVFKLTSNKFFRALSKKFDMIRDIMAEQDYFRSVF